MKYIRDLKGQKFGSLTVLKDSGERTKNRAIVWECVCDCGNYHKTPGTPLLKGATKTCGCGRREYGKTHGLSNSKLYERWTSMLSRCYPTYSKSHLYYKKGIKVCSKWKSFKCFADEMGSGFEPWMTLDRIDNSKGYNKDNCRWVDTYTQCVNRKGVNMVTRNGLSYPLKRWCRELDLPYNKVLYQVQKGVEPETAVDQMLAIMRNPNTKRI